MKEKYSHCTLCRRLSHVIKIIGLFDSGSTGFYCSDCIFETISRSFKLDYCQECGVAVVVEDMTNYPNDTALVDQVALCPDCYGKKLRDEALFNCNHEIDRMAKTALDEIDEILDGIGGDEGAAK